MSATTGQTVLNLRVGELVEVRSREEILRTLDERGTLDSLPFMPEMLRFCGRRFRVYRRADKACDTVDWGVLRRMESAVHLERVRCDGGAHGGCEAGCLMYWKEAWLKRVPPRDADGSTRSAASRDEPNPPPTILLEAARSGDATDPVYSCQATELVRATSSPLPWWKPGQYIREIRSGNSTVGRVVRGLVIGLFNKIQLGSARVLPRFALIQGGNAYPFLRGSANGPVESTSLNLQPGDWVEVKSKAEILATLDERDATNGLRFDREMLHYCGRRGQVLRRVSKIINEKNGKMLRIRSDCIIIDGFICTGDLHRFCPRGIYPYWRESWLKRVEVGPEPRVATNAFAPSGAVQRV